MSAAAAGVIATRPATTPEAMPSEVTCLSRIRSTRAQPSIAPAVATVVLTQARPAVPSAVPAEPPLKPNQPNHSRAAPSMTSGRLWGFIGSLPKPLRAPTTRARTRPATPALMWTTVPPAKSTGSAIAAKGPSPLSRPPPQTMWARGAYTISTHSAAKTSQVPSLTRSAIAPEIRAVEMIAKVIWKPAATRKGTPLSARRDWSSVPARPRNSSGLPNRPPTSVPKAIEYPATVQAIATTAMALNDISIMFSTVRARTMPP